MRLFTWLFLMASVCSGQPMSPVQRPEAPVSPLPTELRQYLALTSAQVNAVVRLREQHRQETATLQARLAELRAVQLTTLPARRKPGLRDDVAISPETESIRQQIQAAGDRYRLAVRAVLGNSQIATLDGLEQPAALMRVIEQAQCFALLTTTPPDEPAACGEYQREP